MNSVLPKIKPMLAVKTAPFDNSDFLYEIKWDGYRGLAYLDDKTIILSRNQLDLTPSFPELHGLHLKVKQRPTLLDGEIVVLQDGKPSFGALQGRSKITDSLKVARLARQTPATFIAFDILFRAGENVMDLPLKTRKEILNELVEQGPDLIISQYVVGSGLDFFDAVSSAGLEGVMAKRLDSPYLPGKRSSYWKKIRRIQSAELVICGWEKGEGHRSLGSLILAGFDHGRWVYMGKVGTGFTEDEEMRLLALLQPLVIESPVLAVPKAELRFPTWVKPEIVCEVTFTEISHEGRLRHPSYKGTRPDKMPEECPPIQN